MTLPQLSPLYVGELLLGGHEPLMPASPFHPLLRVTRTHPDPGHASPHCTGEDPAARETEAGGGGSTHLIPGPMSSRPHRTRTPAPKEWPVLVLEAGPTQGSPRSPRVTRMRLWGGLLQHTLRPTSPAQRHAGLTGQHPPREARERETTSALRSNPRRVAQPTAFTAVN